MTEHGIRFVRWRTRDVVLGTLALIAISVALVPIGLIVHVSGREDLGPVVTLAAAASEALIVLVVWRLAIRRYVQGGWAALGVRSPGSVFGYLLIPVTLIGSLGFTALYELVVTTIGVESLVPEDLPTEMFGEGALRAMTFAVTALMIPFVEELFFRGFLFTGLAARFGAVTGLVVSAALFAIAHADVRTMIPIFVAGLLFGWAYYLTRSLWVPIGAHACQNLVALMFLNVV